MFNKYDNNNNTKSLRKTDISFWNSSYNLLWLVGWVGFYGISTVVGYLMSNPVFTFCCNLTKGYWMRNNCSISIVQLHVYIYKYTLICGNIINQKWTTSITNEYTSSHKYKSLTLYFRKGDVLLCVRDGWRQGQTDILIQVLLLIIGALLLHLGWGRSTMGHWGPSPQ